MASSDLYLTTESEITSIANAIRSKGGTLDFLTYPTGFVTAIEEIQTGGALQSKSVTPSESSITVVPDIGYDGLSQVSVDAISSNYVGSNIPVRTSADLTASGSIITAPAGYYSAQVTKAVSSAIQATPTIIVSTAGLITATATQTAGYVTAGSKSATKQLTTKAATAYTPSTANQTIASGQYLTGVQTIVGDSNLIASNIKLGTNIFGVSGTYEDFPVTNAVLHINAPIGSTITLSHASISVELNSTKGHQNTDGKTMDWYYSVGSSNYGYWAISAFNSDADSTYASVTIDSAKQYDVELTYFVYIVRDGVLDSANFPPVPSSIARGQTSGSYYCFESIGSGGTYNTAVMRFGPIPTFDKVFTRLVFDVHSIYLKSTTSRRSAHFGIRDNGSSVNEGGWQVQQTSQTAPVILEMDVSAISLAGQYVGMSFYNTAASGCNCYVSNIYLAR